MDEWTAKYLEEWQVDFGDEPNAEQSPRFIQDVLSALKQLPSSGVETVAPSVIATIKSQQDLEESLDYSQGVVFEAAVSSPLDSSDLAQVTRLLVQELPHPRNEWFQREFANNARERWNGMLKFTNEEVT